MRARSCGCVRACVTASYGRGRSHPCDLVSALKPTNERRERPNQAQASRLDGAQTAGAAAMCRAAPCPRAAGRLRHRNRLDPFGRRHRRRSRRRRSRPCEAYVWAVYGQTARNTRLLRKIAMRMWRPCIDRSAACPLQSLDATRAPLSTRQASTHIRPATVSVRRLYSEDKTAHERIVRIMLAIKIIRTPWTTLTGNSLTHAPPFQTCQPVAWSGQAAVLAL